MDLRATLDHNLKRKIVQLELANKKKKQLEDEEMTVAVKYLVEDGLLKKQVSPGREKFESCSVVQKEASDMILRCTNLFLFLTKK